MNVVDIVNQSKEFAKEFNDEITEYLNKPENKHILERIIYLELESKLIEKLAKVINDVKE